LLAATSDWPAFVGIGGKLVRFVGFVRNQHGLKLDQLRLRNQWSAAIRVVGGEQLQTLVAGKPLDD
jgi:hypothetical protein